MFKPNELFLPVLLKYVNENNGCTANDIGKYLNNDWRNEALFPHLFYLDLKGFIRRDGHNYYKEPLFEVSNISQQSSSISDVTLPNPNDVMNMIRVIKFIWHEEDPDGDDMHFIHAVKYENGLESTCCGLPSSEGDAAFEAWTLSGGAKVDCPKCKNAMLGISNIRQQLMLNITLPNPNDVDIIRFALATVLDDFASIEIVQKCEMSKPDVSNLKAMKRSVSLDKALEIVSKIGKGEKFVTLMSKLMEKKVQMMK